MRKAIVNFNGLAASAANVTFVSKRIDTPYRIKRVRLKFDSDCDNTVKISPFVSLDPEAPAATAPQGYNLLSEYGHRSYFLGDGNLVNLDVNIPVTDRGTFLKLYIENSAATTPYVYCQIVIEIEE